jgi:2-isopropylmalate synthase
MLRREQPGYEPPFELVDYKVFADAVPSAEAAIKVRVRGVVHHTAAEGNGPVNALDAALRKALAAAYPEIRDIRLEDYKVRILDGRDGTSATTRVLVDHGDGVTRWTTVGASHSILEASIVALVDGIEHGLFLAAQRRHEKGDSDEGHDRALAG